MNAVREVGTRMSSIVFKTNACWHAGHSGMLATDGRQPIAISSPPEFNGERGVWTPEELFVGAIELCHMNTFMAFAARRHVSVAGFHSRANGVLDFIDGDYRFTRIVLFPTITVGRDVVEEDVHRLLRDTEKHCLLTNSIASIVEVNPTIVVR
jgi:organic hydroperoxide reductase OsmC/OhrA